MVYLRSLASCVRTPLDTCAAKSYETSTEQQKNTHRHKHSRILIRCVMDVLEEHWTLVSYGCGLLAWQLTEVCAPDSSKFGDSESSLRQSWAYMEL